MRKLIVCILVGVVLMSLTAFGVQKYLNNSLWQITESVMPPPVMVEVSPIILVSEMKADFEIITFRGNFTAERVQAGRCDGNAWQDFWYRDCFIARVPGTVSAGFGPDILDQSRFTIDQKNRTITYNVGKPVIRKDTGVVIHHERVLVLNPDDDGGWATNPDKSLSTQALALAKVKLAHAACLANIYESAGQSAQKQYGQMIQTILSNLDAEYEVKIIYEVPNCEE